jgi:penicillin-binding protein 2
MSFAPYENPKYAICILVQNGGSGGGVCGPLVNLVFRGLFARDMKGIRLPLRPMTKVPGNTDRFEKTIEIPAETIAAVEVGEVGLPPEAAAITPSPVPPITAAPVDEAIGETGEEIGKIPAEVPPNSSPDIIPTPTITPEVDAEGSIIPKAIPIPEN